MSSFTSTREDQYSDEAHFHFHFHWEARCGSRGTVPLSQEHNLVLEQKGHHRPYFFEYNVGDTQTVNDQRRRAVLGKF